MKKPILLLDVDGVLNVWGDVPTYVRLEAEFWFDLFCIRIPVGTAARLARLAEVYDIVWCTAWESEAGPRLAPYLGEHVRDLPYITWTDGPCGTTWKLPDVDAWLHAYGDGRAVAWVDDDLYGDADAWALRRGNTLLAKTAPGKGLTEDVTLVLERFAVKVPKEAA
jgi:hypothetical protein